MRFVKPAVFWGVVLLGFQSMMLAQSCSEPDVLSPDQSSLVLRFQRTGGFAGFRDDLRIFNDWTYALTRKTREFTGTLSPEDQQQLSDILERYVEIVWERKSPPDTPDGMEECLDFIGSGSEETLDNQTLEDILKLIGRIMNEAEH